MFIQRQLSTPVQIFSGKFRLTVAVRCPQATLVTRAVELWEGVGGGQMSDMSFIWHNRLPRAVAVPPSRCPNKRAGICFRKFPKNNLVSALSFFSPVAQCLHSSSKILCYSSTHLRPLYRYTIRYDYTTIYLTPAGLTSVQYTQFYICFMTLRLICWWCCWCWCCHCRWIIAPVKTVKA